MAANTELHSQILNLVRNPFTAKPIGTSPCTGANQQNNPKSLSELLANGARNLQPINKNLEGIAKDLSRRIKKRYETQTQ